MLPPADSVWWSVPHCVIDLETDGVDPATAMPCEIAVARFEGGELVGSWSSLINPGRPMSDEVIGVHGITNEMVADAPLAVGDLLKLLAPRELLEGAWPCGYNGQGYDRAILRRLDSADDPMAHENESPHLAADWIDPLVYIRDVDRFVSGSGRHRLGVTCKRWGVEHRAAHRAFGDCEATGRLLWALRERLGELTIDRLLKRQRVRAAAQERDFQAWLSRQPKERSAS